MSCLVDSDGTTFRFRGDFRLLLQTTNNTVYSIEKILFAYELFAVAGSDQCSLIADIGDIGTGEARGLACQQVYVYCIIYFDGA